MKADNKDPERFYWLDMPSYIGVPFRTREDELNNGQRHLGNTVLCGPVFCHTGYGVSILCRGIDKPWHAYGPRNWFERFADRDEAKAAIEKRYIQQIKAVSDAAA